MLLAGFGRQVELQIVRCILYMRGFGRQVELQIVRCILYMRSLLGLTYLNIA